MNASGLLVLGIVSSLSLQSQSVKVLTNRYDNGRTDANLNETLLNADNVNVRQFGKVFEREVDGDLYAQPLIATNVAIPGRGMHNVVYLATANNSVYAYDADAPAASSPYWHLTPEVLGQPVPRDEVFNLLSGSKQHYLNFERTVGITSTPVIDEESKTIYVVTKSREGKDHYVLRLHALDIATGRERTEFKSPVIIEAAVSGNGVGSRGGTIRLSAQKNLNRPGLLLNDGVIYLAFGSHNDDEFEGVPNFQYHGWVLAYDARTLQQTATYCTTPDGIQGGIWQSGAGLAAETETPPKDRFVYAVVGNGTTHGRNYGESILKLNPSSTLSLVESFTPSNAAYMNDRDLDLSSGPVFLRGTNWLVACGKDGKCYLLDRTNMSLLQEFQASMNTLGNGRAPNVHGAPVVWCNPCNSANDSVLSMFVWGEEDHMRVFTLNIGDFRAGGNGFKSADESTMHVPAFMPGAMLTLSANGNTARSGIVWASHPFSGDANNKTVAGILRAFDASNIEKELWNSKKNPDDDLGMFAKFNSPVVANGKVYVGTFADPVSNPNGQGSLPPSNKLVVYGLLPNARSPSEK